MAGFPIDFPLHFIRRLVVLVVPFERIHCNAVGTDVDQVGEDLVEHRDKVLKDLRDGRIECSMSDRMKIVDVRPDDIGIKDKIR